MTTIPYYIEKFNGSFLFGLRSGSDYYVEKMIDLIENTDDATEVIKIVHEYRLYDQRRSLFDKLVKLSFSEDCFDNLKMFITCAVGDTARYEIDLSVEHLNLEDSQQIIYYLIVCEKGICFNVSRLIDFSVDNLRKFPVEEVIGRSNKSNIKMQEILQRLKS